MFQKLYVILKISRFKGLKLQKSYEFDLRSFVNFDQGALNFIRSSLSSTADINVDNNVEEMIFETPKIVYAKEVIVKDEVPVRQCEPGLMLYPPIKEL